LDEVIWVKKNRMGNVAQRTGRKAGQPDFVAADRTLLLPFRS
jgi:hypothetical protein